MGFFQDLKEDLSQAVTELVPEEDKEAVIDEKQAEDDLAEIEAMLREKEDAKKEEKKERKIDMNAIFNQPFSDEVSNITAGMVKELRELTGAGMMDCKKALEACEGNMDKAVDWLREKGIAKAAKKESRIAADGLCEIKTDGNKAVIVEVIPPILEPLASTALKFTAPVNVTPASVRIKSISKNSAVLTGLIHTLPGQRNSLISSVVTVPFSVSFPPQPTNVVSAITATIINVITFLIIF